MLATYMHLGLAALYIAAGVSIDFGVALSDLMEVAQQPDSSQASVRAVVWDIMSTLDHRLHCPAATDFVRYLLKKEPRQHEEVRKTSRFLVEVAAVAPGLMSERPSRIAAAAVWLARFLLSDVSLDDAWVSIQFVVCSYYLMRLNSFLSQL